MDESVRWTKVLVAIAVCISMISGMLFILPNRVAAAPLDGYIEGNVSDGTDPLPGSIVVAMPIFGGVEIMAWTDAIGDYLLSVPGGLDYYVMAFNDSCYGSSAYASVAPDETVYLDFTLENIAPAVTDVTVMGFVRNELGDPMTEALIGAYTADPATMGDGPPLYLNMTRTDGTGLFVVEVLPSIAGGGVAAIGVPGYPFVDNVTEEAFASGQTYWINLTLEPLEYDDDASISGTVTDYETGLPIENVMVTVETWNETTEEGSSNITWTDSDGNYYMDIKSGSVRVRMSATGYTMYSQENIEVLPGDHVIVDAELTATNAVVRGTVTDRDTGLPINMARVFLFDQFFGTMNMAFTDVTGAYTLEAFDGTDLVIGAETDGYGREYMMIDINPGDELWIDFELGAVDAYVYGTVTDAYSSLPIEGVGLHYWSMTYEGWDDTDANGDYGIDLVSGDYTVEIYSPSHMPLTFDVTIYPGPNEVNVQLVAVDAWVFGVVTDAISGLPIEGAGIYYSSMDYDSWNSSNSAGEYSMNLVSGDYTVGVNAPDYRYLNFDVTIYPGLNMVDIELMPWDIPDTVRVYGFVNSTATGVGIDMANVEFGTGAPDYSSYNWTQTNSSGYYEMYIPAMELTAVASAWDHCHAEDYIDASEETEMRVDFWLYPDEWAPNLTYSQTPTENVSWINPAFIHAMAQELDAQSLNLWQFMSNGSEGGWSYYYMVEALGSNLNPLQQSFNNLPFWYDGDSYIVDYVWTTNPMCGWLTDGVSGLYLPYFEMWMGPDVYCGLQGEYVNSSMMDPERGTAWFDSYSGEFAFFTIDGSGFPIMPDDPTGVFIPYVNSIKVMDGTTMWNWMGTVTMGNWSVVGLMMSFESTAPSGNYAALFYVADWSGRGAVNLTLFTVDNDPPVADAGPGQEAVVDATVALNGNMSCDNVGIDVYMWTFDDGGYVELYGEVADHEFTTLGNHTITLTVWDGAGHSNSATTWVEVVGDQPPEADAGVDQDVVVSAVVQFDGTGSWDDVLVENYTWTIVELAEDMWGPTPQFTFAMPGTYHVSLVVRDTIDQPSAPDEMLVTVYAIDITPPTAEAGDDQTRMGGELVILNGSGSWDDVLIVNWTWTFDYMGSPVELWGEVVNFTFWDEGVYDVTLTVRDVGDNSDTDVVQITIAGMIPEFPTMMLPVTGILLVVLFVALRRRRL